MKGRVIFGVVVGAVVGAVVYVLAPTFSANAVWMNAPEGANASTAGNAAALNRIGQGVDAMLAPVQWMGQYFPAFESGYFAPTNDRVRDMVPRITDINNTTDGMATWSSSYLLPTLNAANAANSAANEARNDLNAAIPTLNATSTNAANASTYALASRNAAQGLSTPVADARTAAQAAETAAENAADLVDDIAAAVEIVASQVSGQTEALAAINTATSQARTAAQAAETAAEGAQATVAGIATQLSTVASQVNRVSTLADWTSQDVALLRGTVDTMNVTLVDMDAKVDVLGDDVTKAVNAANSASSMASSSYSSISSVQSMVMTYLPSVQSSVSTMQSAVNNNGGLLADNAASLARVEEALAGAALSPIDYTGQLTQLHNDIAGNTSVTVTSGLQLHQDNVAQLEALAAINDSIDDLSASGGDGVQCGLLGLLGLGACFSDQTEALLEPLNEIVGLLQDGGGAGGGLTPTESANLAGIASSLQYGQVDSRLSQIYQGLSSVTGSVGSVNTSLGQYIAPEDWGMGPPPTLRECDGEELPGHPWASISKTWWCSTVFTKKQVDDNTASQIFVRRAEDESRVFYEKTGEQLDRIFEKIPNSASTGTGCGISGTAPCYIKDVDPDPMDPTDVSVPPAAGLPGGVATPLIQLTSSVNACFNTAVEEPRIDITFGSFGTLSITKDSLWGMWMPLRDIIGYGVIILSSLWGVSRVLTAVFDNGGVRDLTIRGSE